MGMATPRAGTAWSTTTTLPPGASRSRRCRRLWRARLSLTPPPADAGHGQAGAGEGAGAAGMRPTPVLSRRSALPAAEANTVDGGTTGVGDVFKVSNGDGDATGGDDVLGAVVPLDVLKGLTAVMINTVDGNAVGEGGVLEEASTDDGDPAGEDDMPEAAGPFDEDNSIAGDGGWHGDSTVHDAVLQEPLVVGANTVDGDANGRGGLMAGVPLAVGSTVADEAPAGEDNVPEAAERFEGGTTTAAEAPAVTGDARCEGDWFDDDILAEATALSLEAAIVVLRDVSAAQGAAITGGRTGPLARALRAPQLKAKPMTEQAGRCKAIQEKPLPMEAQA